MDHQHCSHCIPFAMNWCRQKLHVLCISYAAWFCISHCEFEPMCGKTKHPFSFYARRGCATTATVRSVSLFHAYSECKTIIESNWRVRHRSQTISGRFVRLRLFEYCFLDGGIILIGQKLIHLFSTVPLPATSTVNCSVSYLFLFCFICRFRSSHRFSFDASRHVCIFRLLIISRIRPFKFALNLIFSTSRVYHLFIFMSSFVICFVFGAQNETITEEKENSTNTYFPEETVQVCIFSVFSLSLSLVCTVPLSEHRAHVRFRRRTQTMSSFLLLAQQHWAQDSQTAE